MSLPGTSAGHRSKGSFFSMETLARSVLELDYGILECDILSDPEGAVLASVSTPLIRGTVASYPKTGSGMAPTWALAIINILKRLDKERSPLNYVMVSREKFNAIFFPTTVNNQSIVMGVLLEKSADPFKIFERIMSLIQA